MGGAKEQRLERQLGMPDPKPDPKPKREQALTPLALQAYPIGPREREIPRKVARIMTKLPRPFQSSGQYQGKYAFPAFKLLGSQSALHESLFRALAKYGATIQDMRIEDGNSGNASVTYNLPALSAVVRARLDMLDITCTNLLSITEEKAYQFVFDCWNALKGADESIELTQHAITTAANFNLPKEVYRKAFEPLVTIPSTFDPRTEMGLAFYFPGGSREGDQGGHMVLDSLAWNSGILNLKAGMVIDAKIVPLSALKSYADEYIASILSKLGLEIEKP